MKVIEVSPRRSPFSTMNWIVLLSFLLSNVSSVHSSWWSLSRIPPKSFRIKSDAHALCSGGIVPGLSREQRDLCLKRPDLMVSAARGAKIAIKECKRLFAKSRWNCSTFDRDSSVFGKLASRGHRETALIYALTSAGVVYSVARSCYSGTSTNCSCVMEANHPSGCVLHGERFVRGFVDTREKPNRDARAMMNLRNNEAGRRAVRRQVEQQCKCHGFSGSCSQRTCWHSLKSFRDVGLHLRQKYDAASLMTISQDGRRLVLEDKKLKHPAKSDLVYLEHSPDYCQADLKLGILGTAGRRCNKTSLSTDGCDILCCGRGHDTALVKKEEKCRCKFKWCCQVHCQRCTRTSSIHNCKA